MCLAASPAVARALQAVLAVRSNRPSSSALRHLCHAEGAALEVHWLSDQFTSYVAPLLQGTGLCKWRRNAFRAETSQPALMHFMIVPAVFRLLIGVALVLWTNLRDCAKSFETCAFQFALTSVSWPEPIRSETTLQRFRSGAGWGSGFPIARHPRALSF